MVASKAILGVCNNLLKHMADLRLSRRHENVTQLKAIDEITITDKETTLSCCQMEQKWQKVLKLTYRNLTFMLNICIGITMAV